MWPKYARVLQIKLNPYLAEAVVNGQNVIIRPPTPETPKNSAVLSVVPTDGIKEIVSGNATDFLRNRRHGPIAQR
jgi:hypothetical protein